MGRRSTLRKLTDADVVELDRRIRDSWYGDLDGLTTWLTQRGYDITRSSLHRYVIRLREVDKESGKHRAMMAETKANSQQRRRQLLERLGALRLEESRLLAELLAIDSSRNEDASNHA